MPTESRSFASLRMTELLGRAAVPGANLKR
jgi:hypothetical protein